MSPKTLCMGNTQCWNIKDQAISQVGNSGEIIILDDLNAKTEKLKNNKLIGPSVDK